MFSQRFQNTSRSISKCRAPVASTARLISTSAPSFAGATTEKQKKEGTIASVFASLSGAQENTLPSRFRDLKREMVGSEQHAETMLQAWRQVLKDLQPEVDAIVSKGPEVIPTVQYPGAETARKPLAEWMDAETLAEIRRRGVVRIKGVVSKEQALEWKESIKSYVKANPEVRGFPEDDKQVFELYWSKAQVEARAHPNLLNVQRTFLDGLFHAPHLKSINPSSTERAISLSNVVSYADRLRIRHPGDSKFALGPHIDGGGVERWEDPEFRSYWRSILEGTCDWRQHDAWSFGRDGQKLVAKGDLYEAPGGCSVFRPFQGWLSMSETGPNEGTLRVFPLLKEATAYIVLRPFFRPLIAATQLPDGTYPPEFLHSDNWVLDTDTSAFPGCSLGHSLELSPQTHPHLSLPTAMTSVPQVSPGDMVLWHDSIVHAVEAQHQGTGDSSVMYIPAIPLSQNNFSYVLQQRKAFLSGRVPFDFPGGEGEARFKGRATEKGIKSVEARQAMGLAPFEKTEGMTVAEKALIDECNAKVEALEAEV
ncbi:hypothetical protein BCR35DRAFT_297286 [Leucosporidium creatinivorum]|uniref:DUF1479-domain-containing protein n=1 Tax=Leucosporidium creatinivorum TaxID=106004 RepID=A0A1Y2CGQ7_9BASI|nr:hypothetical protein BCR35DRAFT_297286 [Leucosporidium creatinivorum]